MTMTIKEYVAKHRINGVSEDDAEKLDQTLALLESLPPTANFREGWCRMANVLDQLTFLYAAVSSGKDSVFMANMAIIELQRRRIRKSMFDNDKALYDHYQARWDAIRKSAIASHNEDLAPEEADYTNRIGVMQMDYEITFNESAQLTHRFFKEWATDINKIARKNGEACGYYDSEKSVKELGWDLTWVDDDNKKNPKMTTREEIENMKPRQLREIYGKAMVYGYACYFPIAWENTGSVSDSRYISFDPDKRSIWVTVPPTDKDPYHEWCIDLDRMYDRWHGKRPMYEIIPGMSDQWLRKEFSKYIKAVWEDEAEDSEEAKNNKENKDNKDNKEVKDVSEEN